RTSTVAPSTRPKLLPFESTETVAPAQAGAQFLLSKRGSRLRGNDKRFASRRTKTVAPAKAGAQFSFRKTGFPPARERQEVRFPKNKHRRPFDTTETSPLRIGRNRRPRAGGGPVSLQ